MRTDDEIGALFERAQQEAEALEALDGAVVRLKDARAAKAELAQLEAPRLRAAIERRRAALGGDPS